MPHDILRQSEASFQAQVVELAHACGWLVHAERPARRHDGRWSTPIQGDPGFPDLVLVHPELVLFVELKSDAGVMTPAQRTWETALARSRVCLHHTWRPSDWPEIERVLTGI